MLLADVPGSNPILTIVGPNVQRNCNTSSLKACIIYNKSHPTKKNCTCVIDCLKLGSFYVNMRIVGPALAPQGEMCHFKGHDSEDSICQVFKTRDSEGDRENQ